MNPEVCESPSIISSVYAEENCNGIAAEDGGSGFESTCLAHGYTAGYNSSDAEAANNPTFTQAPSGGGHRRRRGRFARNKPFQHIASSGSGGCIGAETGAHEDRSPVAV